jgi:hypothetical protein
VGKKGEKGERTENRREGIEGGRWTGKSYSRSSFFGVSLVGKRELLVLFALIVVKPLRLCCWYVHGVAIKCKYTYCQISSNC